MLTQELPTNQQGGCSNAPTKNIKMGRNANMKSKETLVFSSQPQWVIFIHHWRLLHMGDTSLVHPSIARQRKCGQTSSFATYFQQLLSDTCSFLRGGCDAMQSTGLLKSIFCGLIYHVFATLYKLGKKSHYHMPGRAAGISRN